jgi:hypothetical protein
MNTLSNFEMTYWKPIPTVMLMNMKKLNETSYDSGERDFIYLHIYSIIRFFLL